jgi:V8-like Glu-specific endopeptidase
MVVALAIGLTFPTLAQEAGDGGQDHGEFTSSSEVPAAAPAAGTDAEAYWTNQRLREAEPMELPAPETQGPQGMPEGATIESPGLTRELEESEGEGEAGSPPEIDPGDTLRRQLDYDPEDRDAKMPEVKPRATSSFGAFFTTKRVTPDSTTTSYPYRTIGKLFFRDPRRNVNNVCSAAVLRPRLVATAGHCVTSPSTAAANRYFFTDFLFVPAFNNGAAPFGSWTSSQQWVANEWHQSDGSVPNSGDIAILVMRDQTVNNAVRTIGSITGWLGYRINALSRNHLTLLGYPCNLDSCAKMQETNAGSFATGGNNTFIYGSASRGGHSGGPWVQDFGTAPAGAPAGLLGANLLVGITSYGPTATEPKYLGSSNLGQNFVNLLNAACNASAGNC